MDGWRDGWIESQQSGEGEKARRWMRVGRMSPDALPPGPLSPRLSPSLTFKSRDALTCSLSLVLLLVCVSVCVCVLFFLLPSVTQHSRSTDRRRGPMAT